MNRREFITKTATAATALSCSQLTSVWAQDDLARQEALEDLRKYDLLMPRVMFYNDKRMPDKWNVLPCADNNLLVEFQKVVRCRVKTIPNPTRTMTTFNALVSFEDYNHISRYPFVFMTSDGYFLLNETEKKNLKKYIDHGGFILMDDCVHNENGNYHDYFFQSAMKLMTELFGSDAIRKIPLEHELFHNVYDRGDKGWVYVQGIDHDAYGLFQQGRLAAIISATDIHCGWVHRSHRLGAARSAPDAFNYENAIKMGINTLMYVMSH